MKLLVVEGNTEETRTQRQAFGIKPYHVMFQEMLQLLINEAVVDVAFPADSEKNLPSVEQLKHYNGVLWTGSSLSVLDHMPSVTRQLNFAESVFASGVPFYGSCWGLQIATVVAGGKVSKSKNGLELGVSKSIQLTEAGKKSPFLSHRKTGYKAICIHYDDIQEAPKNASILAYNDHSNIQAISFKFLKSHFFGVQYHPEFKPMDIGLIVSFLSKGLIANGYFQSEADANEFISKFKNPKELPPEINNYQLHTQDIKYWLNYIKPI